MRIITLETLKTMPNGTVFCEIDEYGNLSEQICILTGRYEDEPGFNGVMDLCPWVVGKNEKERFLRLFGKNHELSKDNLIKTECVISDTIPHDYEPEQLFAVFSKAEIERMIKALQWALSGLKNDFDMDEVLE